MATHSSTLAWKIPWMEKPDGYSPWGLKKLDTTEGLHFHFLFKLVLSRPSSSLLAGSPIPRPHLFLSKPVCSSPETGSIIQAGL